MEKLNLRLLSVMVAFIVIGAICMAGCTGTDSPAVPTDAPTAQPTAMVFEDDQLLIATTTSLYATGLLDQLEAEFEEKTGTSVDITAVGTGTALEYGRNGDVDLIMVHDRTREDLFLDDGSGTDRRVFAYNYFVIVGPEDDPAGISGMAPADALVK